jgi:hypothetical protein
MSTPFVYQAAIKPDRDGVYRAGHPETTKEKVENMI